MFFLFMFHVIACIYLLNLLGSQKKEAGPFKLVQGTTFSCQKWSPDFGCQIWALISFGKMGPFLATKSGLWGPFLAARIGPGDYFWVGPLSHDSATAL